MPSLPTGTVTFLFTDIEGSTRLLQQLGERYVGLLADHHRLLRAAFNERGGSEVQDHGDGFYYSFPSAKAAVQAAIAAQRSVAAHPWPDGAAVRVRMGLHTGEPVGGPTGLVGIDIHRAARICAAGHGGQILISEATRALVVGELTDGASLKDLGEHRLKDLARPQRLFQLIAPGLLHDFPPMRSLNVLPNNLPLQLTSFVGRRQEIGDVKRLLRETRLLTLTGIGGAGKTRLALHAAAEVLDDFPDGVWFADLAPLADPALVPQTLAAALALREQPGHAIIETLLDYLRPKALLLILDNCEHLLQATAQAADLLLRNCPNLRILATSRQDLGVMGETLYPVPPLSLPQPEGVLPADHLVQSEAVRLFVDRAAAIVPGFKVSDRNARAVVQVCARLDGIPLALEFAAARVKVLPVEQIAARLDDVFGLLMKGARTAPPRHQTLRAAMDWSHDLLSEPERVLFRRLAVFAGGFTLEAAEGVCAGDTIEARAVLNLLSGLVDKSLVVHDEEGEEAWYRLLEPVRQYAHERLEASGETAALRARHLDWYVRLVEPLADPDVAWGQQMEGWLRRLGRELGNVRGAFGWSLRQEQPDAALSLAGDLWPFWENSGYLDEGRGWLKEALTRSEGAQTVQRARVLAVLGRVTYYAGEIQQAVKWLKESLAMARSLGDSKTSVIALNVLGWEADAQGGYAQAASYYEESLAIIGHRAGAGVALLNFGSLLLTWTRGDRRRGEALLKESLAVFQDRGIKPGIANVIETLGELTHCRGDLPRGLALMEEALAMRKEIGGKRGIGGALNGIGVVAREQGDYARATALHQEALALHREIGSKVGIGNSLGLLGLVAMAEGDFVRAEHLFRESLTVRKEVGTRVRLAFGLGRLGSALRARGDLAQATPLLEESLAAFREFEDRDGVAMMLYEHALLARDRGELPRAATLLREGLALAHEGKNRPATVRHVEALATVAAALGRHLPAARLLGFAAAQREAMGTPLPPADTPVIANALAAVRDGLGSEAFASAWAEGTAMTVEQAVDDALRDEYR